MDREGFRQAAQFEYVARRKDARRQLTREQSWNHVKSSARKSGSVSIGIVLGHPALEWPTGACRLGASLRRLGVRFRGRNFWRIWNGLGDGSR